MFLLVAAALQVQARAWVPDFTVVRDVTFYEKGVADPEKYEMTLMHKQGLAPGIDVYVQTFTRVSTKETVETSVYRLEDSTGWRMYEGTVEKESKSGKEAYEEKLSSLLASSAGKNAKPVRPEVRKTIAGYVCSLQRYEEEILGVIDKRRDYWMPVDEKVRKRVGALEFDVYERYEITKLGPIYSEVAKKVTLAPRG
jgi:hypothetical protein